MTRRSTYRQSLVAVCAAAITAAGCSDEPTQPGTPRAPSESASPRALDAAERSGLTAAFAFAREQAVRGLQQRNAADRVAAAFAAISARVEAGDRDGAERALAVARAAIQEYRRRAGDDRTSEPDLEALTLTLDHATAIVRDTAASTTTITSTTTSTVER